MGSAARQGRAKLIAVAEVDELLRISKTLAERGANPAIKDKEMLAKFGAEALFAVANSEAMDIER